MQVGQLSFQPVRLDLPCLVDLDDSITKFCVKPHSPKIPLNFVEHIEWDSFCASICSTPIAAIETNQLSTRFLKTTISISSISMTKLYIITSPPMGTQT